MQDLARYVFRNIVSRHNLPRSAFSRTLSLLDAVPHLADGDFDKRLAFHADIRTSIFAQQRARSQALFGSVLGQCVGDALGFLIETTIDHAVARRYANELVRTGQVVRYGNPAGLGQYGVPRYVAIDPAQRPAGSDAQPVRYELGQYTDDSQLMRELLLSIAQHRGVLRPAAYGQRVAAVFARAGLIVMDPPPPPGPAIVGYGETTRRAAARLAAGVHWALAGSPRAGGDGGCMRVGPLGVLFAESPLLAQAAAVQSIVTHASSRCQATAVMIAAAAQHAAVHAGLPFDATALFAHVDGPVRAADTGVADAMQALATLVRQQQQVGAAATNDEREDAALPVVIALGLRQGDKKLTDSAISSSTVQASLWALYSFVSHPDSYMDCVCCALSGAGDADTTAAMAGALSGARLGPGAVPEAYVRRINDDGTYKAAELQALCEQLDVISGDQLAIDLSP
jgi:ADP-ribosylglycohydrolase